MKSILFAASLAIASTAWAAPAKPVAASAAAAPAVAQVTTRDVPVNQFLQGRLTVPIALNIPVMEGYEQSKVRRAGYSYWMRPADAATATPERLPTRNGYIYGATATSVTYDARHKVFYGVDDPGSVSKMRTVAANVQVKQFKEGKHPAVTLTMISGTTGKPAYMMYMATGVKNEVFFISLRAPEGRQDIGDAVWKKLEANIK